MSPASLRKGLDNIKKLHIILAFGFAFSVVVSPLVANDAFAAAMTQTEVRFDRMKISTFTSGTVCAKPATAATEASVVVTFPSGYTVSTTTGNWTVSTTNLAWPATATAWLGINTATAASGQDVTFPSSDLVVGTLYCFNWTNTAAALQTKGSATSSNAGVVTTRTSAPATIDTGSYSTATIADDQIVVTATVPQVFSFALSANTDALGTLSTASVITSPTPRTVTVNTNAKNGWQVWAKNAYQGLCAPSVGTCTVGTPTTQIATTSTGSNRTLSAGTSDYNTGVTTSQTSGSGTIDIASYQFTGTSAGQGGGLSATAFQTLAASNGTANNAVLTVKNNVSIDAIEAAAADYTDTITIVGAGLF